MRELLYHVATTLDGFIAHPDGGVHGFLEEGEHIADYQRELQSYDTILMGRKTYEFGYRYGLQPGDSPYPWSRTYVVSRTLVVPTTTPLQVVREQPAELVRRLRAEDGGPIYLCGGSELAAYLLEHDLIDAIKLKINPVIFGDGLRLFGASSRQPPLCVRTTKHYANGVCVVHATLRSGA